MSERNRALLNSGNPSCALHLATVSGGYVSGDRSRGLVGRHWDGSGRSRHVGRSSNRSSNFIHRRRRRNVVNRSRSLVDRSGSFILRSWSVVHRGRSRSFINWARSLVSWGRSRSMINRRGNRSVIDRRRSRSVVDWGRSRCFIDRDRSFISRSSRS